jgi:hypothetical protein
MTKERTPEVTPRMQRALFELQALISKRYPDATFRVTRSPENPETVLLKPVVDVDDRDEVMDVVIDRLGELQSEEQLSLLVVPTRPKVRNEAIQRAMQQTEPTWHKQPPMPGFKES